VDLLDFLDILWRRKWIIVVTTIVAVIVAIAANFILKPIYTSSALLRVSAAPNPSTDRADLQYVQRLMNTYTIIASTKPLLSQVISDLQLDMSSTRLEGMIEVKAIEETELIELKVTNSDAQLAADIANSLANALISQTNSIAGVTGASAAIQDQINQIQTELGDMRTQYNTLASSLTADPSQVAELSRDIVIKQQTYETLLKQYDEARLNEALRVNSITLIEPASPPKDPTSPKKTLNIALGVVLGLMGGTGLALVFSNVDNRVYNASHLKRFVNLPIVAELGKAQNSHIRFEEMPPAEREAYRRLRANVFSLQKDHQLKSLMITSPEDGEGKSTITYNLAVSIAQLGFSVLVIDCDMRRSNQHILFNVLNDVGLTTVLEKKVSLSDAIQETHIRSLDVLTSGPRVEDPTKLLGSAYAADLLLELAPKYDVILLDTPAVLPVVDVAMLAPIVDGILIVARCGKSSRESILSVQSQIADLRARPLGWILNDAPIRASSYHTKQT